MVFVGGFADFCRILDFFLHFFVDASESVSEPPNWPGMLLYHSGVPRGFGNDIGGRNKITEVYKTYNSFANTVEQIHGSQAGDLQIPPCVQRAKSRKILKFSENHDFQLKKYFCQFCSGILLGHPGHAYGIGGGLWRPLVAAGATHRRDLNPPSPSRSRRRRCASRSRPSSQSAKTRKSQKFTFDENIGFEPKIHFWQNYCWMLVSCSERV